MSLISLATTAWLAPCFMPRRSPGKVRSGDAGGQSIGAGSAEAHDEHHIRSGIDMRTDLARSRRLFRGGCAKHRRDKGGRRADWHASALLMRGSSSRGATATLLQLRFCAKVRTRLNHRRRGGPALHGTVTQYCEDGHGARRTGDITCRARGNGERSRPRCGQHSPNAYASSVCRGALRARGASRMLSE